MKLTTKVMKEVHKRVRLEKQWNPEMTYRQLMSIVMKKLYKEIKNYRENKSIAFDWVRKYINHNNNIFGTELKNLMDNLYIDLNIKHFDWDNCFNISKLSKVLATKYSRNLKLYA